MRLGMLLARLPGLRGANPQPAHAMRAQFEASGRFDCTDRLARITGPTLIPHGRSDHVAPVELARQLHAGIASSHLVLFDGGHLIALMPRHRKAICASIVSFLAQG